MQAQFEWTDGLVRLRAIINSFPHDSSHWNEAQNRFQFVDRLLTECLGWVKPDLRVEVDDQAGGRTDYTLGTPAKAVLEAKREAVAFDNLPTGKPTVVRKIAPMLAASKGLSAAVKQVLQYCVLSGAPIAVVCNGPQLAILQALTPGYSPLEGECFYFDSFQSYLDNFHLLWSLLSPEGISENRARRDLAQYRNPRIPSKASEAIPEPSRFRYRNGFQENLRVLSSLLLEEVEDNPALKTSFYKECYVPLEANNRHLLLSKQIIGARYRRVGDDSVVPSAFDTVAQTDDEGQLLIAEPLLLGSSSSRPIVVIGDVGVGKTAFFENLFEKLDRSERTNTLFIHINLGIKANLSSDVKTYVLEAIPDALKRDYDVDINEIEFARAVYYKELQSFARSVKGALKDIDPVAYQKARIDHLASLVDRRDIHLQAALGHLSKGRGKHIILIIDNADQRTFEIQQEAFLIAQEFAATRNLLVFIALRPSTFYQSKTTGALSAYQNKILTIAPPPADEVIQRRLTFAVRVAEGKVAPAALPDIRLQIGSIVSFFNATLRSIRTNESIRLFLSNITGGNTRGVIELITGFFGSPNVDSQKIVRIEQSDGDYKVPLHEFAKHALLGEYAYYNAQSSLVACNIFDVSAPDPREHFLAGLITSYLGSNVGRRDNDGFSNGETLLSEMAKLGYSESQTRTALRRLASKRLIETPHAHYRELSVTQPDVPEQFHYRATSAGLYHARFWTGSFAFLDAMSTDTPVFDNKSRDEIVELAPSFDIGDRFRKAVRFRSYLDMQWQLANVGANYYDFAALLSQQDDTFISVRQAVARGPRRSFGRN